MSDATHIFDGLDNFPTHVAHMRLGSFVTLPTAWPFPDVTTQGLNTRLYSVALQWLKEDRTHRAELEKGGRKKRGAKTTEVSDPLRIELGYFGANICTLSHRYLLTRKHSTGSELFELD